MSYQQFRTKQIAHAIPGLFDWIDRLHRQRTHACLKREYERAMDSCDGQPMRMWAIREAAATAKARIDRRLARKRRRNRKARKAARALCVAIYDCNRAFGGPEEGGWWYDTGSLVSVEATFFNREHAYPVCRALNDWCDKDNEAAERRPIHSVLCDGVLEARIMPFPAPAGFPDQRPHYE